VIVKSFFCTVVVQAFTATEHVSGKPRVTIHVRSNDKTDSPSQLTPEAARDLASALLEAAARAEDTVDEEYEEDDEDEKA
jgi:hypothetical protein